MHTPFITATAPIVRIALAPALIGLASWIGRRWGPRAGGWFSALPLTSGPAVLILAIERGPAFAAATCAAVLLALVSLSACALAYAWSAQRVDWYWSSLLGCLAYLGCAWLLHGANLSLPSSFAVACAVLALSRRAMPNDTRIRPRTPAPGYDIPLRMLIAALLVWTLARLAGDMGPRVSGLLAPFPIAATLLAAFTHRSEGPHAAGQFLRSMLGGLYSFAAFFLIAGLLLIRQSTAGAFTVATVAALLVHATVWYFNSIRRLS